MKKILDFDKLNSPDPKVKYGFTRELIKTGKENPKQLYEYLESIVQLLNHENNIIKWTAIDLVGYLSFADNKDKIDKYIPELINQLKCGKLITSNHAIFALGLIAQNKPAYKNLILDKLLLITKYNFDTEECKNIATGKVLEVLQALINEFKENKKVLDFIKKASSNSRNSTRKKANRILNKIKKSDNSRHKLPV